VSLSRKRVCITGGAGFIGSHLVERLLADNEVVVYDNLHRNALQFAHLEGHPHLHFIKGDVMDLEATKRALDGAQIVIHCAAIAGVYSVVRNSVTTMEVNLLGTHRVIEAARSTAPSSTRAARTISTPSDPLVRRGGCTRQASSPPST